MFNLNFISFKFFIAVIKALGLELYDSSTIMLDALTLEKPVVQFILGLNNDYSSNLEDPISVNSYQVEIKEVLSNYFNDNFYSSLIQKIPQKLKQYISYYGDSCERTSRIITE